MNLLCNLDLGSDIKVETCPLHVCVFYDDRYMASVTKPVTLNGDRVKEQYFIICPGYIINC